MATSEHGTLPLDPIDKPSGLFMRLMYWAMRRRYAGVTPTAFRVVYARVPAVAVVSMVIITVLERFLKIGQEMRFLIQLAGANAHGCTFCEDLNRAEAVRKRIGGEKFADFDNFEESDVYSEKEKAALAYVAAVSDSLRVEDAVFDRLKASFTEREVTEIVWLCAVERYYNTMALPLRIGSDGLAQA